MSYHYHKKKFVKRLTAEQKKTQSRVAMLHDLDESLIIGRRMAEEDSHFMPKVRRRARKRA